MFTGIIEDIGIVKQIEKNELNVTFTIESSISKELKVDQSVAHNGVCLTVIQVDENTHKVTAIHETLQKTNLSEIKIHDEINLERCMLMNGRLDGHLVQGHVDCTATYLSVEEDSGSWLYEFEFPNQFSNLVIEKGSICVNGTSLTCFGIGINTFKVAIIPYTYFHTNIKHISKNSSVNIEFDIIGKYLQRQLTLQQV